MPNESGGGSGGPPTLVFLVRGRRWVLPSFWTVRIGGALHSVHELIQGIADNGVDWLLTEGTGSAASPIEVDAVFTDTAGTQVANDDILASEANEVGGTASTSPAPGGDGFVEGPGQPGETTPSTTQPRPTAGGNASATTGATSTSTSTGGSSTGAASGSAASSDGDDSLTEEQTDFRGVPPGMKAMKIGDRILLAQEYHDPQTGEQIGYIAWWVPSIEEWEDMIGELDVEFIYDGDVEGAMALGVIEAGTTRSLAEFDDAGRPIGDPMDTFYEDYDEKFALSPLYGDPEVLAILIEAAYEGDTVSPEDLAGTTYYQTRTQAQREWDIAVLEDPATAQQRLDDNRRSVRTRLAALGYVDAPDSLVNYLADNNTTGVWSNERLLSQLAAEVDPYSANASPFAGIYDWSQLGQYQVVTDGSDYWVRTEDGDYRLDGPGQIARFKDQAIDVTLNDVEGDHVIINGQHYLVKDGAHYLANGPGQVAGLTRLYGEGIPAAVGTPEPVVAGLVQDLFGGPGGIESYGEVNEVGVGGDLAALVGGGNKQTTQLGREEEVRNLVRTYVGPYHADRYSDEFIARWAGRLRNEGPGTLDLLQQDLQRDFRTLFPGYDGNDLSYESIAGAARGQWQQYSGSQVDEGSSAWLSFLQQAGPAAENREGWLRQRGIQEGWAPTVEMGVSGIQQAYGPQVRRSAL